MREAHPLAPALPSMPGVRTAARTLLDLGDDTAVATPRHLTAYAGPPPSPAPGSSIRGKHPPRGGNPQHAFFPADLPTSTLSTGRG